MISNKLSKYSWHNDSFLMSYTYLTRIYSYAEYYKAINQRGDDD
jgi:hypothetical protein